MTPLARLLPVIVLLGEVLFFHRRVLFSPEWTVPWDFRDYHLPLAAFMARNLASGELPLWDPYTYCGVPFYANIQTQFGYPPLWIALVISSLAGGSRLVGILEWYLALHVFLAGALAYWLLRHCNLGRPGALYGATIYQLGGYFASQLQHVGAITAAAWLPLAWLAIFRLARQLSWRWVGALALALAMSLTAGFPAVTIVVWTSTLWLGLLLAVLKPGRPRILLLVSMAATLALLMSAVQLLPALEASGYSTAYDRGQFAGTGGGVPLLGLVSLLVPGHHHIFDLNRYQLPWNPTFLYLYCGLPAPFLALVAVRWWRSPYRAPLIAATLLALAWMLGENTPLGRTVFLALPVRLRSPLYAEFAMAAFQMGLSALAAGGAQALLGRRPWLVVLLAALAAADLTLAGSNRIMNTFAVADDPAVTSEQFEGSRETLEQVRALVNQTLPPARLEAYRDSMRWANSAPMTGIPTASGNDPLAPARILAVRRLFGKGRPWMRYWELDDLDSPLPDLLNVRYLVSWAPSKQAVVQHPKWRRVADLPGHQVYENSGVLPRFFLVGRVRSARNAQQALSLLGSAGFNPRREAIVETNAPVNSEERATGTVRVLNYSPRKVILEAQASGPAFLVSSETYYPGWRAWIDGRRAELVLTNAAFRGLLLPAGRHIIRMDFQPTIFWFGLGLSLAGWVLLAMALRRDGARGERVTPARFPQSEQPGTG